MEDEAVNRKFTYIFHIQQNFLLTAYKDDDVFFRFSYDTLDTKYHLVVLVYKEICILVSF